MLHSDGHYETSEEHVVGGVEIIDGDLARGHDSQHGQQYHGNHRGHRQGQGLCQPVDSHQQDAVGTSQGLANLRINGEEQDRRQEKWRQQNHPGAPEYSNEILQRSFLKDKSYEKMTKVWPSKNILALFIFRNREILTILRLNPASSPCCKPENIKY